MDSHLEIGQYFFSPTTSMLWIVLVLLKHATLARCITGVKLYQGMFWEKAEVEN